MRAVWGSLLLMHLWPLLTITGRLLAETSLRDLGSLAVLLVLIPLFLVKALDLRIVRTRRPALEFIVWLVCAGLAHSGPISETPFAKAPAETAAVASIVAAAASKRVRRRVGEVLTGLLSRMRDPLRARLLPAPAFHPASVGHTPRSTVGRVRQRLAARPPPSC